MTENITLEGAVCPLPLAHSERIVMGHGSGGKMSHDLVARVFPPRLDSPGLRQGDDAAGVQLPGGRLAISTDAHVVWPLFFPGGDIGRLAVCGTVNDVAMLGARPRYLTAGFILEEGLEIALLERVVDSMRQAAGEAGVQVVAGDTKVVQRGKADGLYITTTGVGEIPDERAIGGALACPGDVVLVSGTLGDHGIAVLAARGELGFEIDLRSDVAPLNGLIETLLAAAPGVHVLRDPTRGGLATTLNEIALQSRVCITLDEGAAPLRPEVAAACEALGFDPLYVANEGKLIVILPQEQAEAALQALRGHPYGAQAALVGRVTAAPAGRVLMRTRLGSTRIVDRLAGELLPRIC
ncbi:MAG: hydrogenase expression/formation protein HypE [Chloroflexota bacterium]